MKNLLGSLLFFSLYLQVTAQTVDTNYVDGQLYVQLNTATSIDLANYDYSDPTLNAILLNYNVTDMRLPFGGLSNELDVTYELTFGQLQLVNGLIAELEALPYVVYAEPKPLHRISVVPNDVHPSQWALTKINAFQAWDLSTGNAAIKIAIVDNAVSTVHQDLVGNIWVNPGEIANNGLDDDLNGYTDDVNGFDVANNDPNPNPPATAGSSAPFVHGTHCAGIASATSDNGVGIASLGFNTTIIAVKCTPDNSPTQGNELPNAYDGVYYAIRAGADVISMSWGGGFSSTGQSIFNAANSLGIVLVAAAGNDNTSAPFYPAAFNNVISVGATDATDAKSSFSNYGTTIDVMAPGSGIYSTLSGNGSEYGTLSGTSMACPLVSALAALVLDEFPGSTPQEVEAALKNGCDNIDALNPSYVGMMGAGRINAYKTLLGNAGITSEKDSKVLITPNPSNGFFLVQSVADVKGVKMFNLLGEAIVCDWNKTTGGVQCTSTASAGRYILRIETEKETVQYPVQLTY